MDLVDSMVKSDQRCHYFSSYLKIWDYVIDNQSYGAFTFEQFVSTIGVTNRTAKTHLTYLLDREWIRVNPENKDYYQVVSMKDLVYNPYMKAKRRYYVHEISSSDIKSFSSKNPSVIRAYFIEFQKDLRNRYQSTNKKTLAMKIQETVSERESIPVDSHVNMNTKVHGGTIGTPVDYVSYSYMIKSFGRSLATHQRYRKIMNDTGLVNYVHNFEFVAKVEKGSGVYDTLFDLDMELKNDDDLSKRGRHIIKGENIYFSPITIRHSHMKIKRRKNKHYSLQSLNSLF